MNNNQIQNWVKKRFKEVIIEKYDELGISHEIDSYVAAKPYEDIEKIAKINFDEIYSEIMSEGMEKFGGELE